MTGPGDAPSLAAGTRGRWPATIATLGFVALYWLGVATAGALVPGYAHRDDYISALASRGSPVAPLGMATISSLALAHMAGGLVVRRAWRARAAATSLAVSALFGFVIAGFRIYCPDGPPGCGFEAAPPIQDLGDVLHGHGVRGYQVFTVLAMAALAVGSARGARWPRWLGAVSVPVAVVSTACLLNTSGADNGLWQRLWLASNTGWLVLVALAAWQVRSPQPGTG